MDSTQIPDEALNGILAEFETICDSHGWDQPWTVWVLVAGEGDDHELGLALAAEAPTPHPWEGLNGIIFSDDVLGAILVTEGWSYPEKVTEADMLVPASQHPDRREVRILQAVMRDGRTFASLRRRGCDQAEPAGAYASGRIMDALKRTFALPAEPTGHRPAELFGMLWLSRLAGNLVTEAAGGAPIDDRAAVQQVMDTDPYLGMIAAGAIDRQALADALHQVTEDIAGHAGIGDGTCDADTDDGAALLNDMATVAESADIDPVPAALRERLAAVVEDAAAFHAMAATNGFGPYSAEDVAWLGPDLFLDQLAGGFDKASDLIATIDTISPVAGQLVRSLLVSRGWIQHLPDPGWRPS